MKTEKLVNAGLLQGLAPLNALGADVLGDLAHSTYFETLMADEVLVNASETDASVYYVLSGEVTLHCQSGETRSLIGGSSDARVPLIPGVPGAFNAVAKSSIIFVRVPLTLVEEHLSKGPTSVSAPPESDADVMRSISDEIDSAIKANKLVVPSLPDVAIKVREAVQSSASDAIEVARIIQADPPLAARLIQVANGPVYRGNAAITNCRNAVSRLGLKTTRDLVMSCSLQQLFDADSPVLQRQMKEQWQRSTFVGAISFVLARLAPYLDADRALLGGLLHNIGALPLIAYAPSYPTLTDNSELLLKTIDRLGPRVGEQVLRRWHFDNDLVIAIAEANNWTRDSGGKADYCDVIQLAQLYSFIDTPAMADHPTMDQIPAFGKLPLGRLGPKMTVKVLEEARADIEEMQKLLGG